MTCNMSLFLLLVVCRSQRPVECQLLYLQLRTTSSACYTHSWILIVDCATFYVLYRVKVWLRQNICRAYESKTHSGTAKHKKTCRVKVHIMYKAKNNALPNKTHFWEHNLNLDHYLYSILILEVFIIRRHEINRLLVH